MDNLINEIRRDIKLLRDSMQQAENFVQTLIAGDRDCSESSQALLQMRIRMAELCREKTALGDKSEVFGQLEVRLSRQAAVQSGQRKLAIGV